jgi:hypothetical protein
MKIIHCEQRTDEWFAARLGVPSASSFDKIITTKGELSKQAQKYLYKLAGEKVSGRAEDMFQSAAMQRGCELEDEARSFYQIVNDVVVDQVGFCISEIGVGCSPDGLVGEEGGLEIKCPIISTHVEYLLNENALISEYFQQVQGSLFVTGRKWWDLISYYPALKPLVVRIYPDTKFQEALKSVLSTFCADLSETIKKIQ